MDNIRFAVSFVGERMMFSPGSRREGLSYFAAAIDLVVGARRHESSRARSAKKIGSLKIVPCNQRAR
jgi:hypothetical protein